MELKENEIKSLKLDVIDKGIASLLRAIKATKSPIIADAYQTHVDALQVWKSQIKASK